jgi:uncharacterized protein (DUF58 family)
VTEGSGGEPGFDPLSAAVPAALVVTAVGVALGSVTVLLGAVVPLGYAASARLHALPEPDLAVERSVTEDRPRPGEAVAVTLSVANVGEAALPEVRIADGVPDALTVVDGDTACCTSLRPGEETTLTYTVRARRGEFVFDGPTITVRSVGGGRERRLDAGVGTTVTCETTADAFPLTEAATAATGRIETDAGGEGVTFAATRPYRLGDPVGRVDWKRFAATGELTTVEFRETRAATVLFVVDTSASARTVPRPGDPTGLSLSTEAIIRLAGTLLDGRNHVGVATLGNRTDYLPAAAGREQAVAVERFLADGDAGDAVSLTTRATLGDDAVDRALDRALADLTERIPPETQVVFCSPLLTDDAVDVAEHFRARDHSVLVVSPDATAGASTGGTLDRLDRDVRLRRLQRAGVRTVDWSRDDALEAAFERAAAGWSG